jgi:4-carboxymuconolactone decarboxylase
MSTAREDGVALLREMIPFMLDGVSGDLRKPEGFAVGLGEQSVETVFGRLWVRPELDRRSRSLLTLGILIALHAEDELKVHYSIALRNGLTRQELEEVVYHAAAYAGFPAAALAGKVGRDVLDGRQPEIPDTAK